MENSEVKKYEFLALSYVYISKAGNELHIAALAMMTLILACN